MYCSQCGNELKNNEKFCPNCGAKNGPSESPANENFSPINIKIKAITASEMKDNFISGVADLGKYKMLLFANIALLLLSMIFSLTNTFKAEAWLGISQSMSMFDEMTGTKLFFIACYILSIVTLVFPLLLKKAWKPSFFLPAKIITILSTLWFFIVLIAGLNEVSSSEFSSMAEFTLTATGWLFIVATLGAMALSFKIALDFKKAIKDTASNPKTNTTYE